MPIQNRFNKPKLIFVPASPAIPTGEPRLLNIRQAAAYLKVRIGFVPFVLIHPADLRAFIQRQKEAA